MTTNILAERTREMTQTVLAKRTQGTMETVLAKRTRDHRAQDDAGESLAAVEQQAGVAGQNPLPVRAERANLGDELRHTSGVTDLLRIVGAEDAARRRQLDQRRLHRLDLAAHAGGVEDEPLAQIVVEVLRRQFAVQ